MEVKKVECTGKCYFFCINYKKVIQYFEKRGVEMQEESEDVYYLSICKS